MAKGEAVKLVQLCWSCCTG